jgi:hypothetical protein
MRYLETLSVEVAAQFRRFYVATASASIKNPDEEISSNVFFSRR